MDENNEVLETEAEVSEEVSESFDDSWSLDDEGFDLTEEDTGEEDGNAQPESDESEETDAETEEPGDEGEEGNQLFEINYLGNKEQLTLKQMTELAQKGRDYDHVREERDKLKGESGKYANADKQLAFLKDLADRAGISVDEQIDRTRALWLMNEELDKGNDITEEEALKRVKENNPEQKDYTPQIDRFLSVYPDVKWDDIPQEVIENTVRLGGDLLSAYQAWEIKTLRAENAKQKKEKANLKNERRSTGPLSTAGTNRKKDDFDEGWDS